MRFLAAAFSLVLSAALAAAQAVAPVLNTPAGVQECYRTELTWTGGTGPYQIQVLPGDQPMAAALEDLGTHTGASLSWLCRQAANTRIFLRLRDTSTGQTSSTATITVLPGDPSLCAAAGSSTAASASAPASSQPAAGTTPAGTTPAASSPAATGTTPAPTTANGSTGTSKPQSSNTSKTTSGASSAPSGGAGQLKAPVALAVAAALAMTVFA